MSHNDGIPMLGKKFGRLLVVDTAPRGRSRRWLCLCDCGNKKTVYGASLRAGDTTSCGCAVVESIRSRSTKHGAFGTPEYNRWSGMKSRCHNIHNKDYANYGGRGIDVCPEWRESFEAFYNDMGPVPFKNAQIDRIDNNKGYSASNCRWATIKQNSQNTRNSLNITFQGETLAVVDWAKRLGIGHTTLYWRLNNGWPLERALTTQPATKNQDYKKQRDRLAELERVPK